MKRCPICEFIYEDDQRLCDMDGMELVHERLLPSEQNVSRRSDGPATKSPWRILTLAIVSGILCAILLVDIYNLKRPVRNNDLASTQTKVLPPGPSRNVAVNEGTPTQQPSASPSPTPSPAIDTKSTGIKRRSSYRSSLSPAIQEKESQKPPESKPKNDSKVKSFFKKTGQLIKKPFKL
jgi:hypothetical protein